MNPARAALLVASLVAAASAAALAVGCAEETGCQADTDCPSGQVCAEGTCKPVDLGGQTGRCSVKEDCARGEECLDGRCLVPVEGSRCSYYEDPTCADGEVCTLEPDAPCEGEPCVLPLACRPRVGEARGARMCVADEDCDTGVCLDGVCFRPCTSENQCPIAGFRCEFVSRPAGVVKACIGVDAAGELDPGQGVCFSHLECPEGRVCRFFSPMTEGRVLGLCVPATDRKAALAPCAASPECETGYCSNGCAKSYYDVCNVDRCLLPCGAEVDCPIYWSCGALDAPPMEGATGTPIDISEPHSIEGELIKVCRLPFSHCDDDVDCCPRRNDFAGTCDGASLPEDTFCGLGLTIGGRIVKECHSPRPGEGVPGTACAADADCASGLCQDTSVGRVCTSLCKLEDDRCEVRTLPGTTCQPSTLEFGGATLELATCR